MNKTNNAINEINEIGSEFDYRNGYICDKENRLFDGGMLTYSGRTAIYAALSDILSERKVTKAWLPSYCCHSMTAPFHDLGIPVSFYTVNYDHEKGSISRAEFDTARDDIVLSMGYFGFDDGSNGELMKKCRDNGITVIEDCTHTLLSDVGALADYRISSLRKWFPTASGGYVQKKDGDLRIAPLLDCDRDLIELRICAMKEKTEYLSGRSDENAKQLFLDKYRTVNDHFSDNYKNVAIDAWSESVVKHTDIGAVIARRRENAAILLNLLGNVREITPVFSEIGEGRCPLFVPIVTKYRSALQKYLAKNKIYCPAHWPRHSAAADSNLYDTELSLICDQRYDARDMEKIAATVKDFCKEL